MTLAEWGLLAFQFYDDELVHLCAEDSQAALTLAVEV
jgi:hypothetical protein